MQRNSISSPFTTRSLFVRIVSFTWIRKSTIVEIIALFFVILFLYTGVSKLMDYYLTIEQMADSPILKPVASIFAWALPVVEFIISLLLFLPYTRRIGLSFTLVILVAFTIYIMVILNYSSHIPCSCGGIISELTWTGHLIFNGICILVAGIAIFLARK